MREFELRPAVRCVDLHRDRLDGRRHCNTGFRAFPQVGIAEKLSVQLTRLEQEFGLTPAARSRVSVQATAAVVIERVVDPRKARFFQRAEVERARVTEEARRRGTPPPEGSGDL